MSDDTVGITKRVAPGTTPPCATSGAGDRYCAEPTFSPTPSSSACEE